MFFAAFNIVYSDDGDHVIYRVYPFLCRAVRNFVLDHTDKPIAANQELYVAFDDIPTKHK